ncbi:DUF6582 domain-containing protein [Bradyrhizobium sp. Tv2a-2]|uniref:DUF6582 domain-containing protein n=1 Tax=Bradyrhizobium sp. Tv2a-2 TaxID=113395 RepID=UPI00042491A8|nr:DUF6582 domain-containing protein [Bradyrhizobium sp. Tv2a-2]
MQTAKLDKKSRDALSDEHFAVPGKRKLPINDEHHTKLAWDMVDRTQGLTPEERSGARSRILHRAKDLGIDTKDWHKVQSMAIECMALNIANDDNHPNKMPFSGVLTKLDEPSDAPPGGARGRRIIVTSEAASKALGSLLGMAVDFTPSFDGHDTKAKIGIITSADIVGNEIRIEGFVYAADFPETAELIQALKDVLGFSFEAERLYVEDPSADVLRITDLTFTGAAILRKDKAAYTTTSLAASAEEITMTVDELKALLGPMLAEAVKPLADRLDKVEGEQNERVEANATTRAMVEPHCAALDACHAAMAAAGVGVHPGSGHVHVLRRMSDSMRAEAAIGKIPHIFRDHDYPMGASADTENGEDDVTKDEITKLVAEAVTAAVKPMQDQNKELADKLAAAETKLKDASEKARLAAEAPARKTVNPMVTALLAKSGIGLPEGEDKLAMHKVDEALKAAGLDVQKRIMVKNELGRVGALS